MADEIRTLKEQFMQKLEAIKNQEELEKLIDETDARSARENCEALDRFFGTTETGHAADAVCDYIIARLGKK